MVSNSFWIFPLAFFLSLLPFTHALTLNLLAVFDIHLKNIGPNCSDLNPEAVRHVGALEYAIYQANLNETYEHVNVSLHVIDTCGDAEGSLQKLHDFAAHAKEYDEESSVHGK